jgi:hypothetical protein
MDRPQTVGFEKPKAAQRHELRLGIQYQNEFHKCSEIASPEAQDLPNERSSKQRWQSLSGATGLRRCGGRFSPSSLSNWLAVCLHKRISFLRARIAITLNTGTTPFCLSRAGRKWVASPTRACQSCQSPEALCISDSGSQRFRLGIALEGEFS